ncbi:MAG: hypothetical protein HON94_03975 [Methylococcales bacterium]|jgi:hypothetical protein|nr:hypothetical protein [Methylococcales bacterium]
MNRIYSYQVIINALGSESRLADLKLDQWMEIPEIINKLCDYMTETLPSINEAKSLLHICIINGFGEWEDKTLEKDRDYMMALFLKGLIKDIPEIIELSIFYKNKKIEIWDPISTSLVKWKNKHKKHMNKIQIELRERPYDQSLIKLEEADYRLFVLSKIITFNEAVKIEKYIDMILDREAVSKRSKDVAPVIENSNKDTNETGNIYKFSRRKRQDKSRLEQILKKQYGEMLEDWPEIPRIVKALSEYMTDRFPSNKYAGETLLSACIRQGFTSWQGAIDEGQERNQAFIHYLNGLLEDVPEILQYNINAKEKTINWDPLTDSLTRFIKQNKIKLSEIEVQNKSSKLNTIEKRDFRRMVIPKIMNSNDINAVLKAGTITDIAG